MAYVLKNKEDEPLTHNGGYVFMSQMTDVVKGVDMNKRILHMTGTAEVKDRDGDIVSVTGGDLNNYLKNPVFLWSHVYSGPDSVPLGKAIRVIRRKNPARLDFEIQFSSQGLNPFADMILALYHEKIINASSIGFIPREWQKLEDSSEGGSDMIWARGRNFTKWELLELSGCAVPANPAALQNAVKSHLHPQTTENDQKTVVKILLGEKPLDIKTSGVDFFELEGELQEMTCKMEEVDDSTFSVQVPVKLEVTVGEPEIKTESENDPPQGVDNTTEKDYNLESNTVVDSPEEEDEAMTAPITEEKGICGSRSLPLNDADAWDGSGARRRIASWAGGPNKDDVDWGKYKQGFVWVDPNNADNFGGYKLPFADVVGGKLTAKWGGVKAAMGAVLGARGGTQLGGDKKAAYNFLAAYYRKFDKEVPEFHSVESMINFLEERFGKGVFTDDYDWSTDSEHQNAGADVGDKLVLMRSQGDIISVNLEDFVESLFGEFLQVQIAPTKLRDSVAPETTEEEKAVIIPEEDYAKLLASLKNLATILKGN